MHLVASICSWQQILLLVKSVRCTKNMSVEIEMSRDNISYPMMTSSNGNIFRVTCPLCEEFTGSGEFPAQRPVTRSFDVFFDLRLNKRLSKQSWGWWFQTPPWPLWRQCNALFASADLEFVQAQELSTTRDWGPILILRCFLSTDKFPYSRN